MEQKLDDLFVPDKTEDVHSLFVPDAPVAPQQIQQTQQREPDFKATATLPPGESNRSDTSIFSVDPSNMNRWIADKASRLPEPLRKPAAFLGTALTNIPIDAAQLFLGSPENLAIGGAGLAKCKLGITNPLAKDILSGKTSPGYEPLPSSILAQKPRIRLSLPDEAGNPMPPKVIEPKSVPDPIGPAPLHFEGGTPPEEFNAPKPIQGELPLNPTQQPTAQDKLLTAIESAIPKNLEQASILSSERAKKIGEAKTAGGEGESWAKGYMRAMKGEHTKLSTEPLQLEQTDVDSLFTQIKNSPNRIGFEKLNAITGLGKVLRGEIPQVNEIQSLKAVFGDQLANTLTKKLPFVDRSKSLTSELVNLPKELMASYDTSAPLRQGIGLIHKKEYWTSFDDMFKSFGSEKAFKAVQESIAEKPTFELGQKSGLSLTDLITKKEEQFMSNLGERIPILGAGVRASNRAYVGFLNKLRADTFETLINNAEKAGLDPHNNLVLSKEIANYVNTATGRGSLGSLEKYAGALNNVFFSPRLVASRLQMMNPNTYIQASPTVRQEYLKSLFAIASAGLTVTTLGKMAGGSVESNPTSSDFGKIKFGNTRLDPWAGHQQYVVAAERLLSGKQTSSTTGNSYELGSRYGLPTRLDVAGRFAENKLNPVLSFATTMLRGKDISGQPVSVGNEIASRFVPLLAQDVWQLAQDDPTLLPLAIPANFGMGLQTYGQR